MKNLFLFFSFIFSIPVYSQIDIVLIDSLNKYNYYVETEDAYPFSPTTDLSFSFPDTSSVTVEIYCIDNDSLQIGAEPVVFIKKTNLPGALYKVNWNRQNSKKQMVPHGFYIYKLNIFRKNGISEYQFLATTKIIPL